VIVLAAAGLVAVVAAVLFGLVLRTGGRGSAVGDSKAVVIPERPASLLDTATCQLPPSFRFTSAWELVAPDLTSLVGEEGELIELWGATADTLAPLLKNGWISGSAEGFYNDPSYVEIQVRLADDIMRPHIHNEDVCVGRAVCSDLLDGLLSQDARFEKGKIGSISAFHVQADEQLMARLGAWVEDNGVCKGWTAYAYSTSCEEDNGDRNEEQGEHCLQGLLGLAMSPERLSVDLWLAEDGLWPLRIDANGGWELQGLGYATLTLSYEVTEIEGTPVDMIQE
jgi:hypothetical protein